MESSETADLSVLGRPSSHLRKRGQPSLYSAELEKTQSSGFGKVSQPAAWPNRASRLELGSNDYYASHVLMPDLLPIDIETKKDKKHEADVGGDIIKGRKNKREELKRKYGKPKGPVDVERQGGGHPFASGGMGGGVQIDPEMIFQMFGQGGGMGGMPGIGVGAAILPNGAQCARSLDGTSPGRPPTTTRSVSKPSSSYWSVPETTYFPTLVDFFGRDWTGISDFMETKTSNMVKNHFAREVLNGKQWLEDRAQVAEERNSRGEPPGFQLEPIPPPKRKYDTTASPPPLPIYSHEARKSNPLPVWIKAKPPAVENISTLLEGEQYKPIQEDQSAASYYDQESTQRIRSRLGLSNQGFTLYHGKDAVPIPYTVSEDRTGNPENVMIQRLSALGRCYGSPPSSFSSRSSMPLPNARSDRAPPPLPPPRF